MPRVQLKQEAIAKFCREERVRGMALCGSASTENVRPESDVDALVEFDADHTPGLPGMARLERYLERLF
ncbi:MAG: hypothetical protein KatS3mg081_1638 [Gemmatimonadales bacterium]|nr:MAG: hypothetical protein KatS3mg081_1638 [Gemmatimonadales bacterium]